MKLSQLASNLTAEREGAWVALPCGIQVKVARLNNPAARARQDELRAPYKHLLRRGGEIPREESRRFLRETVCETVLLDWKGIEDEKGKEIPYTAEFAKELFAQDEYQDLFAEIVEAAGYRETFLGS